MSDRENDIEFDFFEEPDTRETRGAAPPPRSAAAGPAADRAHARCCA